ncbi:MAG: metal ABC transporter ATP-binding protein [Candidatus Brockarchaeota archaeon]|nr:metal ABC transporter ATP-binding protein [Candidatus Brockarchaeota archaeon]
MSQPIISLRDVSVRLNGHAVLEDVSFNVESPSFITIVGPNGAGKTTLIKLLLGMIKPIKGSVKVLGMNPFTESEKLRSLVGYVPQKDRISYETPLMVWEVVLMGIFLRKRFPRTISSSDLESARKALECLGMEGYWEYFFNELSGGQQRRVLIARALASDPVLLLLDEVFAGLDSESQQYLLNVFKMLRDRNRTILIVEHELDPIMELTEKILVLNKTVCAYGDPNEVLSEDKLKPIYPCLRTVEKEGRRIFILGDKHA